MIITTKIKHINEDLCAEIGVSIKSNNLSDTLLRSSVYEAILRAMRDTNKKAFYTALSSFAEEDFDNAMEFLSNKDVDNDEE